MFSWLKQKEELDSRVKEQHTIPVITLTSPGRIMVGEPVKSLIEAMRDVHQWEFKKDNIYGNLSTFSLTHLENKLCVRFVETYHYMERSVTTELWYGMDWMTSTEKMFVVEAFKQFKIDYAAIQEEYRTMELQIEREKFMVFVKPCAK